MSHRLDDIDLVADLDLAVDVFEYIRFDGFFCDGLNRCDHQWWVGVGLSMAAERVESDDASMGGAAIGFVSFEGDATSLDEVMDR